MSAASRISLDSFPKPELALRAMRCSCLLDQTFHKLAVAEQAAPFRRAEELVDIPRRQLALEHRVEFDAEVVVALLRHRARTIVEIHLPFGLAVLDCNADGERGVRQPIIGTFGILADLRREPVRKEVGAMLEVGDNSGHLGRALKCLAHADTAEAGATIEMDSPSFGAMTARMNFSNSAFDTCSKRNCFVRVSTMMK
ncbi:hypothetical protein AGR2A_Cc70061 [Agrobacterium genomosp. 2 str. CFBP 5494]|uniref:Uncharacterized protein n=1 Tax=Agrobacterium genomosp. 2 str. CFBP 5494 TaxID=1183436 RepID=A0A9W5B2N1_9HYPH|nr:hypothetical protein AGR2A_Cc70061 [Agrobacterium genomosp. 2 str. CFBP 5494]